MECPACSAPLAESDKQSGPDEPEVGWEYYVCPDCGNVIHPGRVEPSYTSSRPERRTRFTGTVVQASTPPILDDGDETVELQDLSGDVRLGEEVTVSGVRRERRAGDSDYADYVFTDSTLES